MAMRRGTKRFQVSRSTISDPADIERLLDAPQAEPSSTRRSCAIISNSKDFNGKKAPY